MSQETDNQEPSAFCVLSRARQANANQPAQRHIIEIQVPKREEAVPLATALITFAVDALIFLCITHLAASGVLPGIIAGGLIGSLVGARIYAARTRAIGLGGSSAGALALGVLSLFSLRGAR